MPNGCTAIMTFDNPCRKKVGFRQLDYLPCYVQSGRTNVNPGPGMALHLEHGSILFDASTMEFHGATRVHQPNFYDPQQFVAVCFCALVCDVPNHGHGTSSRSKEWNKITKCYVWVTSYPIICCMFKFYFFFLWLTTLPTKK